MISNDTYLINKIEEYFDVLKVKAVAKFKKGRAEHGDNLSLLDCDAEIQEELIDIIIYGIIRKEQVSWRKQ